MTDTTTLGLHLRLARECRGLTLRDISDSTKLSMALLEGLEADNISRWPGGIFRRAFVRSYAQCVGLDADDVVRRFELQYPSEDGGAPPPSTGQLAAPTPTAALRQFRPTPDVNPQFLSQRDRIRGTAADLGVAIVLAFGFAAAGSRLLWPVLLIALYYAAGILLTGTSPMVALLREGPAHEPDAASPSLPEPEPEPLDASPEPRPARKSRTARRSHRRPTDRPVTTQDAEARI